MANTLTNLMPDIYAALDVVSQEPVGLIPNVSRDPNADRVAVGQTLRVTQAPVNTAGKDITPAMALPAAADQVIANKDVTMTKARAYPFSWSGEEQKGVDTGPGYLTIQQDQIAQAMRALRNEMEGDVADAGYKAASRAWGTAGTAPFATDLKDPANLKKILDDNGAGGDRHLCINTTAGVNLRGLTQLTNVNQAGSAETLRRGTLLDLSDFMIHESAQIKVHTAGTGAGTYQLNGAHAVGATTLAVDTGAGTILAGDVITIANGTPADSNKYVVTTALNAGNLVIAAPGLRSAHADNDVVTVSAAFTGNIAHTRQSILLATRLPAIPKEGDLALDRYEVTDPLTGIVYEFAVYPGYHMNLYEVGAVWGVKVIKPEHVAILFG
jgi:hypothetical protein